MPETVVEETTLEVFTPDEQNANLGTDRGRGMLAQSLQQVGAGRSIVTDKHGTIIAGNKTHEAAKAQGFKDAIVVETDGTKLVVTKRTDLDLSDDNPNNPARRYAYLDNRVGQVNLHMDPVQIQTDLDAGFDFAPLYSETELEDIVAIAESQTTADAKKGQLDLSPELLERHDYIVFYFDNELDWQVACEIFDIHQVQTGQVSSKTLQQKGLGRVLPGKDLLETLKND